MSDRELLEKAAKAAGIDTLPAVLNGGGWGVFDKEHPCPHCITLCLSVMHWGWDNEPRRWNPLTDDSDAFRLAVKLHMDINSYPCTEEVGAVQHRHHKVCEGNAHRMFERTFSQDACAATRRAIVRAAAEIGKMKP